MPSRHPLELPTTRVTARPHPHALRHLEPEIVIPPRAAHPDPQDNLNLVVGDCAAHLDPRGRVGDVRKAGTIMLGFIAIWVPPLLLWVGIEAWGSGGLLALTIGIPLTLLFVYIFTASFLLNIVKASRKPR